MRTTDLRDRYHWRRRYGSVESTWLGRSCGAVSTPPERTGTKLPKPTLEYSLDTFSSHDIQDLLSSALIQTAPRISSHDIGCLDVEVARRQSSIGLLDEGGNRSIIIRERKERPQAVWNWKLSAIVKGNCWWSKVPVSTHARLIRRQSGADGGRDGVHSRITSNARAPR